MKIALTIALILVLLAALHMRRHESIVAMDGDTVMWRGETYRLLGFDTPETYRAKCAEERRLGEAAKVKLQALIARPGARIVSRGVRDRYQRLLGVLLVGGRDVALIAVAEGWGRTYKGGRRKGWCPDA